MKFATVTWLLFGASSLAIGALPVADRRQQQHQFPIVPSQTSGSISSDNGGSSIASGSSRTSKTRHFLDLIKLKPSTKFQCHAKPQDTTLSNLALDIHDLLQKYRIDLLIATRRIDMDTCHAGYEPNNISPSIMLTTMKGQQAEVLTELLNNLVIKKFPGIKMVSTREGIALVQEKARGIRRRATI
ncbi:MAG: hypothetical protein Q9169_005986 [Polycauliona sp. 2 TL-2023]